MYNLLILLLFIVGFAYSFDFEKELDDKLRDHKVKIIMKANTCSITPELRQIVSNLGNKYKWKYSNIEINIDWEKTWTKDCFICRATPKLLPERNYHITFWN